MVFLLIIGKCVKREKEGKGHGMESFGEYFIVSAVV